MNKRRIMVVFEQETEGAYKQLVENVRDERKNGISSSDNQRLLIVVGVSELSGTTTMLNLR
ncbi:MAG: hypothetical protein V1909_03975 [Candidatus Micrarchaeota archaeon]